MVMLMMTGAMIQVSREYEESEVQGGGQHQQQQPVLPPQLRGLPSLLPQEVRGV